MRRFVKIQRRNGWHNAMFKDLKPGDVFMIFEHDEPREPVRDKKGKSIFIAKSRPYRIPNSYCLQIQV